MKGKNEEPTSQWHTLPWQKIQVRDSADSENETGAIDDDEFKNEKNHYDDPKADPNDLYYADGINRTNKYDPDARVEGADDPGIFVGLEVIDGSQYQVEKIKFGKNSGHITRLVINDGDKSQKTKIDDEDGVAKINKKSKKKKDTTIKEGKKKKLDESNEQGQAQKSTKIISDEGETKKLTRKQRNRLKLEKIIAERKERRAEKKRKRDAASCSEEQKDKRKETKPQEKLEEGDVVQTNSKKQKKQQTKEVDTLNQNDNEQEKESDDGIDVLQNMWAMNTGGVILHEKICAALRKVDFNTPTPIQASTLAASILGQRDIVGAAPTGSGKTLSYLLPILQYLLSVEDARQIKDENNKVNDTPKLIALILCPTRELAMQVSNEYSKLVKSCEGESYYNKIKCGSIVGGLSEQKQKRVLNVNRPPVLVGTPGRLWDLMSSGDHKHLTDLTKMRFLVVDEADRMINQGSFPQLTHILEKIRLSNPSTEDSDDEDTDSDDDEDRLQSLPGILGEAKVQMLNEDVLRMIEQQRTSEKPVRVEGIDEEDIAIDDDCDMSLGSSNAEEDTIKRQTFIYSATLTLPSSSKDEHISTKVRNGNKEVIMDGAIAEILEKVGAQGQTKIVDLSNDMEKNKSKSSRSKKDRPEATTRKFKLPPGLSLYEVSCTQKHKDSHLYAFLTTTKQGSSGPCLVFCNSIGAVKRVGETLKTLGLPIRTLHAQMPQKTRMSAVESLLETGSRSVVVATDVAARGLDIPSVASVIHYDVPRATDLFVHRAGRTARGMGANAVGWSVSLISAPEEKKHQKICEQILGVGNRHFNNAPIDSRLLSAAQERVNLASKIVTSCAAETKAQKNNKWFVDAANEAGFDLDEEMLDDGLAGGNRKEQQTVLEAKRAKQHLKFLLAQPMRIQSFGKFLSGAGIAGSVKAEMEVKPYIVNTDKKKKSKKKQKSS